MTRAGKAASHKTPSTRARCLRSTSAPSHPGGGDRHGFVTPCLAKLQDTPPDGDLWRHEIKFDGYRLQVLIDGGDVRLLTRSGLDWSRRFGRLGDAFRALGVVSATLDGEAVVEDRRGVSDFGLLQKALKTEGSGVIAFVAFDLLYFNGCDMRALPLSERKARLKSVLGSDVRGALRFGDFVSGHGADVLRKACKLGLEGIVSKRIDLPYRSGRNGDWIKSKCGFDDEFVIAGFTQSEAETDAIGALVLGYYKGKTLIYAGRVGTGFDHETARSLWAGLGKIERRTSPFVETLSGVARRGVRWVAPRLVAQIRYRGWSADGRLRHAAFKALRTDKPAASVRRPKT